MKKTILLPTLLLGALLTASLAMAAPGGWGGCNDRMSGAMNEEQHAERIEQRLKMMSTVLELSDAQKSQIATLLTGQWQNQQQRHAQLKDSREALQAGKTADSFNEAEFRAQAARQAEQKIEMMVEKAKLKQQIHALLTPEQQAKAELLGGRMGGCDKGRHAGGGCGF